MAAVDEFEIHVEGRGGHGAAPHETADPIVAAARIVEAVQTIVSRELSPQDAAVVTIATIHGGDAFNVIPSDVRLTGTARWFHQATGEAIERKLERIVSGTASAAGVSARLDYRRINRPTVNDPEVADVVIETARRLLGEENVDTETRTMGARTCRFISTTYPAASSSSAPLRTARTGPTTRQPSRSMSARSRSR